MASPSVRKRFGPALGLLFLAVLLLMLHAGSASATITEDDIGCSGSADITDKDGATTHVDAEDEEATIPREGTVNWSGSTSEAVHNHSGKISVDLGLASVPIDDWGSENKKDEASKKGKKKLPSVLKFLPPGTYLVTGSHSGDEGSCAGEIEVTLEGGSEAVWKGAGALLTLAAGAGLFAAGKPRG